MTIRRKAFWYKWAGLSLLVVPCAVATVLHDLYPRFPAYLLAFAWVGLFVVGILVIVRFEKLDAIIKYEEEQDRLRQYRERSVAEKHRRSANPMTDEDRASLERFADRLGADLRGRMKAPPDSM